MCIVVKIYPMWTVEILTSIAYQKNKIKMKMMSRIKSKIKDDPRFGALYRCRKEMISSAFHFSSGKKWNKRTLKKVKNENETFENIKVKNEIKIMCLCVRRYQAVINLEKIWEIWNWWQKVNSIVDFAFSSREFLKEREINEFMRKSR